MADTPNTEKEDLKPLSEGGGTNARETVGELLARTRQSYSQDLRHVAQALRIRYVYLDAIEKDRFYDLPGAAYAIGFVRTYADFLDLDSDEIVERFKREIQGLEKHAKLHFPTPAPESSIPGGAVFLVCAVVAALAYGGWFYLSNQGRNVAEHIPEVPDRLQTQEETAISETPAAEPAVPESSAVASGAQPAAGAPRAELPVEAVAATEGLGADATVATAAAQEGPDRPAAAETVAAAEPQAEESPPAVAGTLPDAANDVSAAAAAGEPAAAPQAAVERVAAVPEAPAAIPAAPVADETPPASDVRQPRVYGANHVGVRIVLLATQDAWVQVRDGTGALRLTRVLRAGDSYRVPNEENLTLLTGNAGGLIIEVDGIKLAPLGPMGAVRRNVSLDPDKLLSGTALAR